MSTRAVIEEINEMGKGTTFGVALVVVGKQASGECGMVRHEGRVIVLAEVDGRVLARSNPLERREDLDEAALRSRRGPPRRVSLVGVGLVADLPPPALELGVGLDGFVALVVDVEVLRVPCLDGRPKLQPVGRVGVVFHHEPHAMPAARVSHGHAPTTMNGNGAIVVFRVHWEKFTRVVGNLYIHGIQTL